MIGHVHFTVLKRDSGGTITRVPLEPWSDYGLYLVEYDDPPPKPKIYRVNIEGRIGSLDMSDWSGDIRYNDRQVKIKFRDMTGMKVNEFVNAIYGYRVEIVFDDDVDHIYEGRCESFEISTRKHVTDAELTFTCNPFRWKAQMKHIKYVVEKGTPITDTITMVGDGVNPILNISGVEDNEHPSKFLSVIFNDWSFRFPNKTNWVWGAMLNTGTNTIELTNNNDGSGAVTFDMSWREGEL